MFHVCHNRCLSITVSFVSTFNNFPAPSLVSRTFCNIFSCCTRVVRSRLLSTGKQNDPRLAKLINTTRSAPIITSNVVSLHQIHLRRSRLRHKFVITGLSTIYQGSEVRRAEHALDLHSFFIERKIDYRQGSLLLYSSSIKSWPIKVVLYLTIVFFSRLTYMYTSQTSSCRIWLETRTTQWIHK